jgi:CubicO group peptidase (beta-lactamase class C family)
MTKRFVTLTAFIFVLSLLLIPVMATTAQSEEIILEPFVDHSIGVSGVAPDGWLNVEPGRFYRDNPIIDDLTQLAYMVFTGITSEQVVAILPSQIGLTTPFESAATYESTDHAWSMHTAQLETPDDAFVIEIALTEINEATYLVGIAAPTGDYEMLHEVLLIPTLDAFAPVEVIEQEMIAGPLPLAYWPTDGWQSTTPEEQGMDSEILASMIEAVQGEEYSISSILVVRHGYIVAEAYFYPAYENSYHYVYSVTKSFISALTGIAIEEGYIEGVDQQVLEFFPEYEFDNMDADKEAITIEDLLTMSAGFPWNERVSYNSGGNSARQIINFRGDWVSWILDKPMEYPPGTEFVYNSGASHLLSVIVGESTGMTTRSYAVGRLFTPLGIEDLVWGSDPDGRTTGGWGLSLASRDMAKFGLLYLHNGEWDGQQIVPAEWVEASTQGRVYDGYGYQWWLDGNGIFFAAGLYGQYIYVVPHLDMVVVVTSESDSTDLTDPLDVIRRNVLPAARSSTPLPDNPDGTALLEEQIEAAAAR